MSSETVSKARPATRRDVIEIMGHLPATTIRAKVLEAPDGQLLGIAGYWVQAGFAVVFSQVVEGAKISKLRIWKESVEFMKGLDVPARCITTTSGRFLERLGWSHIGSSDQGEVYEWQL